MNKLVPPPNLLLLAFFLSLICFASSPAGAISDSPFLIVHKKVELSRIKATNADRITVNIDVYNQGFSTAYDVSLTDASWTESIFSLISGNISNSWDQLDAGAQLSHSFVLESTSKGLFHGAPAIVKFRVPSKSALQEAYSTPIQPLDILADRPPEEKFDWAKKLVGKYGPFVSVVSIVGLFVYVIASPSKSGAKGSKKRR